MRIDDARWVNISCIRSVYVGLKGKIEAEIFRCGFTNIWKYGDTKYISKEAAQEAAQVNPTIKCEVEK